MEQLKTLLLVSRPVYWLGSIFLYIGGVIASQTSWSFLTSWGFLFITFPLGLVALGLNDIADRESDLKNGRKGGFEGYILKKEEIPLILKSVALVTLIFITPPLILRNYLMVFYILFLLLLSYFYSFKPVRLKSRPFLDSLANSLGFLVIFLMGLSQSPNPLIFPKIIWFVLVGTFVTHALTTLWDIEADKKIGDITTGIFLGRRWVAVLSLVSFALMWLLLNPGHPVIYAYLLVCILVCGFIFLGSKKLPHYSIWVIILGFPLVVGYMILFDYQYLQQILIK